MKKIVVLILTLWAGSQFASAQTTGPVSLTDVFGFTNTVVPPTVAPNLQLNDLDTLLLNLQTNMEETLPALSLILSNAANTSAQGTISTQQQSFSLTVGTNVFAIDPPTLQALVILRNNLEQTLPVLQALNGTSPQPATNTPTPTVFQNSPVTSFAPPPMTNMAFTPLTNQSRFVGPAFKVGF